MRSGLRLRGDPLSHVADSATGFIYNAEFAQQTLGVSPWMMASMDLTHNSNSPTDQELQEALARFGISAFRSGQREVIDAVLAQEDALCIMPTGGGKSLCYQLPSILLNGLTIVVSPLIALMKDQVDSLRALGLPAEFINSSISPQEQYERLDRVVSGECRLLYVAPERFRSQRFVEVVREVGVELFAIDEAHCISEWGHDFRHDYTRLGDYRARIGNPPTIALTATATPDVREDIATQLRLEDPRVFVAGFARDNLHYSVHVCHSKADKMVKLIDFLRGHEGSGIIYASSRKACAQVAEELGDVIKRKVGIYHAGLEPEERRTVQEQFMADQVPVIVATNAFGMGIDKADVRFVVHFNLPGTIEAYYQEAGRAGRDQEPAECALFFASQDKYIQEFFIESAYPERSVVAQVYNFLKTHPDDPIEITQMELKDRLSLEISAEGVGTCERLLAKASAIERLDPHRNMAVVRINSDLKVLIDILPKNAKNQRKVFSAILKIVGDDRYQPIYVQPTELSKATNLPLTSVSRALRELSQLEIFDYVPPFRGRAIHVPKPAADFDDLALDFETLTTRKREDYRKLSKMIGYAKGDGCRQMAILKYFGDPSAAPCGHCDSCQSGSARTAVIETECTTMEDDGLDENVRRAIRIALSGVARSKGKFGKNLVAAMLGGSTSAKVTRWNLQKLSTFGMLDYLKQVEISALLESLIASGFVQQSEVDRFRPVINLSERGVEAMKENDVDIDLTLSEALIRKIKRNEQRLNRRKSASSSSDSSSSPSAELADKELTDKELTDKELTDNAPLGNAAPKLAVDSAAGVASVLGTVRMDVPHRKETDPESVPEHLWTYRLLNAGFSVDECVIVRRLARSSILKHLIKASEEGRVIDSKWLLHGERLSEFEKLGESLEEQPTESLFSHLSFDLSDEEVLLLLRTLNREKSGQTPSKRTAAE